LVLCSFAEAISAGDPLFLFDAPPFGEDAAASGEATLAAWRSLPQDVKPYAMLRLPFVPRTTGSDNEFLDTVLSVLQKESVPVFLTAGVSAGANLYPVPIVTQFLKKYSTIKGAYVEGLAFNQYYEFADGNRLGEPPEVRWLISFIEEVAKVRRFAAIALDELHWPRIMSNAWCAPLYDTIKKHRSRVLPINLQRGHHNIARMSALMGLWLEGAAEDWGVSLSSDWAREAGFLRIGILGRADERRFSPAYLCKAMVLAGAMTGATVYHFREPRDLWYEKDATIRRKSWEMLLHPTLSALVKEGQIVDQDAVRKKAKVAYQLGPSKTAKEFHANLADIDGVYDEGRMIHGAYGMERPGTVPELIPNTGRNYWIPIFSAHAEEESLASFAGVFGPSDLPTVEAWSEALSTYYSPGEQGTAFVTTIGTHSFILHTRENNYERQTFRLPDAAAPVTAIRAERGPDGVTVSWPFREGDLDFRVYRRAGTEGLFSLIAENIDAHRFLDSAAPLDRDVTYRVSARTNEKAPYAGTIDYGHYRALSLTLSRHGEEVTLPLRRRSAASISINEDPALGDAVIDRYSEEEEAAQRGIFKRVDEWEAAFVAEGLGEVADLYASNYEDAQGWGFQYALRAYQWFFDRYDHLYMDRQIREWNFSDLAGKGEVRVLLYVRFNGLAKTDATGRLADIPAYFPRATTGEVWLTFTNAQGPWRIKHSNPALPNLNDILSFSAGPGDEVGPGPDLPRR
jgi:hypothetical protein